MGFDLKKFLNQRTIRQVKEITVQPKQEEIIESIQEIVLPEYEPEIEEPKIPKKRKLRNSELSRKVPLNPLSD